MLTEIYSVLQIVGASLAQHIYYFIWSAENMLDITLAEIFIVSVIAGFGFKLGSSTLFTLLQVVIASMLGGEVPNDSAELRKITRAIQDLKKIEN